ncbi:MAG: translocation/assembly module TamB domain-containing protein, partial [Gemmatimonadetes bacterium]|nr:translocation/assembly module TamB domain-containing protein [Gemmatimonadota bacterium]
TDRRLQSSIQLWRTGRQALAVDVELPLDLAFTAVDKRAIDGPLTLRATADSADLGLLEAFTRNLRQVRGALNADVTLTGKWGDTRLGGSLTVTDAAATLPGLGVRWDRMGARIHLAGDSVIIDTIDVRGGVGSLGAQGSARFESGKPPRIDLTVRTKEFRAMDVRNYLTLVATSNLQIHGPLFGATLTGSGTADQGALYFADLITKQIVNLDDPTTADLIDTALVREARLGPTFQNRFVDSLRINDFKLTVGEDFWLRSADANIKLSGAARVAKQARNYRLDGTLTAERGQYSLKMGPITRDFEVDRGTVRFLGTPDLNAELDLTAHHQVKPTDGTPDLDIQARITGTLLVPKLDLVNTGNPQMAETDLVSYLMFGRSASSLQGASGAEGA